VTAEGKGILLAVPGTTDPEAARAFQSIEQAVEARFPGVAREWAYTSAGVRRKAAAQGCRLNEPAEALAALRQRGVTRVAVLALHLSDGMEFTELAETVHGAAGFRGVALSSPLLVSREASRQAFEALLRATARDGRRDAALILVAHGSRQAPAPFLSAAALCREVDRRLFLGAMQCPPAPETVLQACRQAGVREAWLQPCMVVAGFSAKEEIAGEAAGSWKSILQRGGVECVPVGKGLGQYDDVVRIWVEQVEQLMMQLDRTLTTGLSTAPINLHGSQCGESFQER
jgi:sirohydrochlorin cobaltochelatase